MNCQSKKVSILDYHRDQGEPSRTHRESLAIARALLCARREKLIGISGFLQGTSERLQKSAANFVGVYVHRGHSVSGRKLRESG